MKRKKCLIVLPTRFNDGTKVPPDIFGSVLRDIDKTLDYYSIGGACEGVYAMDDGSRARDESIMVWAVVDVEGIDVLKKLAARISRKLKQESIYFEVTDVEFDFIRPSDENGDN
jgi:hypothetical protein